MTLILRLQGAGTFSSVCSARADAGLGYGFSSGMHGANAHRKPGMRCFIWAFYVYYTRDKSQL